MAGHDTASTDRTDRGHHQSEERGERRPCRAGDAGEVDPAEIVRVLSRRAGDRGGIGPQNGDGSGAVDGLRPSDDRDTSAFVNPDGAIERDVEAVATAQQSIETDLHELFARVRRLEAALDGRRPEPRE